MTTTESLRMYIHATKVELSKYKSIKTTNAIENMHIEYGIDALKNQLQDLKYSYSQAIKSQS